MTYYEDECQRAADAGNHIRSHLLDRRAITEMTHNERGALALALEDEARCAKAWARTLRLVPHDAKG